MTAQIPVDSFDDVQRIVLKGGSWASRGAVDPGAGQPWKWGCHLVLQFTKSDAALVFLRGLLAESPPTRAVPTSHDVQGTQEPQDVQVSLGFSRRGLEKMSLPSDVLDCLAAKAPAFMAGAPVRAATHAANYGRNGPKYWDEGFAFTVVDAVLSLHTLEKDRLEEAIDLIMTLAPEDVVVKPLTLMQRLPSQGSEQIVHFGYRDGVSHVGIEGWSPEGRPASTHAAGEFLLGHPQATGARPWVAMPGQPFWPEASSSFFRNGSFGVLHQVEQDVVAFEAFVESAARQTGLSVDEVKAKLCGRWPDGVPLDGTPREGNRPHDDFDYSNDPDGSACPLGSHARRMNPRAGELAHRQKVRPLLRRGMPYGPPSDPPGDSETQRGLFGHFFCASIEEQYEHLLSQWADRVPLGSRDRGGARDPLIGAHGPRDGVFLIPGETEEKAHALRALVPFTRTLGIAYLFYPGITALEEMVNRQDSSTSSGAAGGLQPSR